MQANEQHETTINDNTMSILQVATNLKIVPGIEVGGTGGQSSKNMAIGEAKLLDFCGGKEIAREVEEELRHGKCKHKVNVHCFWHSPEIFVNWACDV